MTQVTVTPTREWERLSRELGRPKLAQKAIHKGVNVAGAELRKSLGEILPEVFATSRTALRIKARAAHSSQSAPAYRVSFMTAIHARRLRAKARKFERLAGQGRAKGKFRLRLPDGKFRVFKAVYREGQSASFRLAAAGGLPERSIGPVRLPRSAFSDATKFPRLARLAERAQQRAGEATVDALAAVIAGGRPKRGGGGARPSGRPRRRGR